MTIKAVKRFFADLDLFATNPCLRSKLEPYSGNRFLGCFSLIIVLLFLALMFYKISLVAKLDSAMLSTSYTEDVKTGQRSINNNMFSINFFTTKSNQIQKYLRAQVIYNNQAIGLVPCQAQQWELIGEEEYEDTFSSYALSLNFCPPSVFDTTVNTLDTFFEIRISYCRNCSECNNCPGCNSNCQSPQNIQQFLINQSRLFSGSFAILFRMLTPYPQLDLPISLNYLIEERIFLYNLLQNTVAYIKFQEFQVKTNKYPFPAGQDIVIQGGFSPQQVFVTYEQSTVANDNSIITIKAYLGQGFNLYDRKLKTIDDVFSYIGGLVGIVLTFFTFFIGKYDEYSYQLKLAQSTFNYDSDGYKFSQKQLTGFAYVKYWIYSWIQMLFFCEMNWPQTKIVHETLKQAREILNIEKLFRRLQYLETFVWTNVDTNLLRVLSLTEARDINEIRRNRYIQQYYQAVIQLQKAATVQDSVHQTEVAFLYLNQILKMNLKPEQQAKESRQSKDAKQTEMKVIESKDETEYEIYQSLLFDLQLSEEKKKCYYISTHPVIAKQARQCELSKQHLQAQKIITQSFIALKADIKSQIMMKIPLKIIHRMRLRAKQMKNQNGIYPKVEYPPAECKKKDGFFNLIENLGQGYSINHKIRRRNERSLL